jgi:hydroxymethylpyrimidine/phosphomethylpyrimidine kinase
MTIAGSDSGGGAGVQADLKTFASMGVHGTAAVTSITAQNTREVRTVHDVPPDVVAEQVRAVADDIGVDAAKTGMLSNRGIIEAVASVVGELSIPLVVDPVMVAKSGAPLLREDAVETLVSRLIPLATVVTPNKPEAERITGISIGDVRDAMEAARLIVEELGAEAAIVKGGHLGGDYSVDVMYHRGRYLELKSPRVETRTTHGTGCAFSAAIAAGIAKGRSVEEAARVAKEFITMAIEYGLEVGSGAGPVNPVSWLEIPAERYRVLSGLSKALDLLKSHERLVSRLVPEVQMNIAMALPYPYARTPLDVAAVPGRIGVFQDRLVVPSAPEFGASRHLARAILAMMEYDPSKRAAANIVYSREIVGALKSMGLKVSHFDRRREPEEVKRVEGATTPWGVREAVRNLGGDAPDAVVDYGGHGKEPLVILFDLDPVSLAGKIVEVARRARA